MNEKRSPTVPATTEPSIEALIVKHAPKIIKDKEHLDYAITKGMAAIAEAARKVIAFNPNQNISPEEAVKRALKNEKTGKQKMYFSQYVKYMKDLGKTEREIYNPVLDGGSVFQNMGLIASRWSVLKSKGLMVGTPVIYNGKKYIIAGITKDCKPILHKVPADGKSPVAINPDKIRKAEKG